MIKNTLVIKFVLNMANRLPDVEFSREATNEAINAPEVRVLRRSEKLAMERTGESPSKSIVVQKSVKRKRKPPKIPWKKPSGMPKRPLSAYNLFFRCEREKMIKKDSAKTSDDAKRMDVDLDEPDDETLSQSIKQSPPAEEIVGCTIENSLDQVSVKARRPHTRTSGIGFANLAKTIASKWKTLDKDTRAVYEAQASAHKERYRREMAMWREQQQKEKVEHEEREKLKLKSIVRRKSAPEPAYCQLKRVAVRRASEPYRIPSSISMFEGSFANEPSSWMEHVDGVSLPSMNDSDRDFAFHHIASETRPLNRRSYSDSLLQIRQHCIRSAEETAGEMADKGLHDEGEESEEKNDASSLKTLAASLDDEDMIDFITTFKN